MLWRVHHEKIRLCGEGLFTNKGNIVSNKKIQSITFHLWFARVVSTKKQARREVSMHHEDCFIIFLPFFVSLIYITNQRKQQPHQQEQQQQQQNQAPHSPTPSVSTCLIHLIDNAITPRMPWHQKEVRLLDRSGRWTCRKSVPWVELPFLCDPFWGL